MTVHDAGKRERAHAAARLAGVDPDPRRLPSHMAIIMDGNGRWARSRGLERFKGHQRGVEAVRAAATGAAGLGIGHLTLYAFSSENWDRPKREINVLMGLLERFLVEERDTLMDNGMRFDAAGELDRLPDNVQHLIRETKALTAGNEGTVLTLALSYGGRDELLRATRILAEKAKAGELDPASIDVDVFRSALYPSSASDVDLLVRTAAEQRVSNFLPFQAVYAEYVSLDVLWPDFRETDFHQALREFQSRERRFGRVDV